MNKMGIGFKGIDRLIQMDLLDEGFKEETLRENIFCSLKLKSKIYYIFIAVPSKIGVFVALKL